MPKQRLVLCAVLGLAVGAYAVDRCFVGATGPQEAGAAALATSPAEVVAAESPAEAPPVSNAESALVQLAERLKALEVEGDIALLPESFRVKEPEPAPLTEPQPLPVDEPPGPTVRAILSGANPAAVAEGRTVRVGDRVADWTVAEIAADHVVFVRDQRRVISRVR